jgi:hypothetical protein
MQEGVWPFPFRSSPSLAGKQHAISGFACRHLAAPRQCRHRLKEEAIMAEPTDNPATQQLTVDAITGWYCIEAHEPAGQPAILLQLKAHDGQLLTLLLREATMGGLVNTLGAAWIEFSALRMGMPNPNRWAEVVRQGDQIQVMPPGQKGGLRDGHGGPTS